MNNSSDAALVVIKALAGLFTIVLVGWFGWMIYSASTSPAPAQQAASPSATDYVPAPSSNNPAPAGNLPDGFKQLSQDCRGFSGLTPDQEAGLIASVTQTMPQLTGEKDLVFFGINYTCNAGSIQNFSETYSFYSSSTHTEYNMKRGLVPASSQSIIPVPNFFPGDGCGKHDVTVLAPSQEVLGTFMAAFGDALATKILGDGYEATLSVSLACVPPGNSQWKILLGSNDPANPRVIDPDGYRVQSYDATTGQPVE